MKKFFAVMFAVAFFALPFAMAQHAGHEHGKGTTATTQEATSVPAKALYRCPMHPGEMSDKPGKCPKCGMVMTESGKAVAYRCPMHPDVVSDKAGVCPKCKRTMTPERFEGTKDYK